jgi:L-rhamnonate dehydratase
MFMQYRAFRKSWGINALGSVIVEVEADDGTTGVGTYTNNHTTFCRVGYYFNLMNVLAGVSTGGDPACYIIENHLSRFVEGEDPRNVERIWDQMFKSTLNYGRKGLPMLVLRISMYF